MRRPTAPESEATIDLLSIGRGSWCFDDRAVEFAISLLSDSGIAPAIDEWRHDEQERLGHHPGGAPEHFSADALLVIMLLAALHNLPMLVTVFRDIACKHISAAMRARLGLPDPPPADDRLARRALYRCFRTRLHSLLRVIDPSDLPKNRRRDPEHFADATASYRATHALSEDVLDERRRRLLWVANALLEASIARLPRRIRRHWHGSVALDATPVPSFASAELRAPGRARARRDVLVFSADPDAALYVRTDQSRPNHEPKLRQAYWAYEATLVVSGNDDPPSEQAFPALVIGMAPLHRPGTAIAQNALAALTSITERGHPVGWLACDRVYSHAQAEQFAYPARALHYKLILDYRDDQLGVQGSYAGALFIEGDFYCPAIPTALINATIDFRAKRIDKQTWKRRLKARAAFRMRPKALPDPEGHVRMMCPAAGGAPTGRCELKPQSVERTTAAKTRIPVTDALRAKPAIVCAQDSVTFPPDAFGKLGQILHYESDEWYARYHTLRNTIEGMNGIAKDAAFQSLDEPERRRVLGVAAQTLFTAMLLAGTNLRRIDAFLAQAVDDADGVPRTPRKRRRLTRALATWRPEPIARVGAPPR